MADTSQQKIVVSKDGPYVVTGEVALSVQVITPNKQGLSWDWVQERTIPAKATYKLCRCGESGTKPFCDGTHEKIGFDGTETASRVPYRRQAEVMEGPTLELSDQENLCAFARFCDPGGKIWSLIEQTDNPKARELVIREAMHCPAGRLTLRDTESGAEIEEPLAPSIGLVEDPVVGCSGPLWIRGGIPVEGADGKKYEKRNRVTLCRCGASDNKPFCNGSHASMMFQDGLLAKK